MKKYRIGYKDQYLSLSEIEDLVKNKNYMQVNKNILNFVKGKRILDLGCNIGNFSFALAKQYSESIITGVDNADYMIEIARELYGGVANLRFEVMEAKNLRFNDDEFDCVCFFEVIEHLEDPVKSIKEIYRVLKHGGLLVLSTSNVYYLRFFIRQIVYDILKRKPKLMVHDSCEEWNRHIFAWDISTLYTLLKISGFDYCSHFYAGSSGFFCGRSRFDRYLDNIFAKLFPFFRSTVVTLAKKQFS